VFNFFVLNALEMDVDMIELSRDNLVQTLWQRMLRDSESMEENYSLQYFKYELNHNLVSNPEYVEQKIIEYTRKFNDSLDIAYHDFSVLQGTVIPFDIIYDSEQESIFIYIMIPSRFDNIFDSKEEWSFKSSEVLANINIKTDVANEVADIID
jgi:hypothetical protein